MPALALTPTDYWARPSFPSTLIYNPAPASQVVTLPPLGPAEARGGSMVAPADASHDASPVDVYDAVAQAIVARACPNDACRVTVAADAAGVFVRYPAGAALSFDAANGWLLAAGVVIDFASPGLPPG
jgi:hypothetical protein